MKLYVEEKETKTVDGDKLVTVTVHESKPHEFKYLIFID